MTHLFKITFLSDESTHYGFHNTHTTLKAYMSWCLSTGKSKESLPHESPSEFQKRSVMEHNAMIGEIVFSGTTEECVAKKIELIKADVFSINSKSNTAP